MRVRTFGWLICLLFFAACAIPEPPPGGPEDVTPPTVVSTVPASGTAAVPTTSGIEITFSESMSRTRFERFVKTFPPLEFSKTKWKGDRVLLIPDGGLQPDTTYLVELSSGYGDHHGVKSDKRYEFVFATSAQVDSGTVAGRVFFRRKPTDKGVVRLFTLPKDSAFAPEAARPDREVRTDGEGTYRFSYLPIGVPFRVLAFQDKNGNAALEPEEEYFQASDTLRLTALAPALEALELWITDPTEPAEITGVALNRTPADSIPLTITLHAVNDTTPPTYYTRADLEGNFSLTTVLQGTYTLFAFVDIDKDSLCGRWACPEDTVRGCAEPCAQYPDTLVISPGDKVVLEEIIVGDDEGEK